MLGLWGDFFLGIADYELLLVFYVAPNNTNCGLKIRDSSRN